MELNQLALNLIEQQLNEWDIAAKNYAGLSAVITRDISFNGFGMQVQCNPERIRSTAAKVDAKTISERKCFLCAANLSNEQKGLSFGTDYTILINPYPIFRKHLTIPHNKHVPQLIKGCLSDMLQLARQLTDFVVFYNGPKCGASAPDHFHFQAGNKGQMPLEGDLMNFYGKELLYKDALGEVNTLEDYLRKTIVFTSGDAGWIEWEFNKLYALLETLQPKEDEPMMNIIAFYDMVKQQYNLIVFPRGKHRPSQFFEEGDKQIVFSPATVDMGGLLITPREEDYHKLTAELVQNMFGQITLPDEDWAELKVNLQDVDL